MSYLWLTALIIFNGIMLLTTLFYLPGNWLMIAATAAFAIWQRGTFSGYTIVFATILAGLGEIIEFVSAAGGAKAAGAGNKAMAAAVIGAITGAILGTVIIAIPIVGTLAGSAAGAALAVLIVEQSGGGGFKKSFKTATAAGTGQILGTGAKFALGIFIWLIFAIAAFV